MPDIFMKNLKFILLCLIFIFFLPATFCQSYEFQIVSHFENPFGGGVGDLTYNVNDGYLYATKKTTLGYGDRVYSVDPENGSYEEFYEHPSESINQLKYITSCNGSIYVDHYPLLFSYGIYEIYPDDDIWTTFFEPEKESFGGMACNGTDLILTEEDYVYTISLSTQEETGREKFITLSSYNGMTWDGEYLWGLATNQLNRAILHKIDSGKIIERITLPSTLTNCRGLAYDGECFWTYVNSAFSPYTGEIVKIKLIVSPTITTTVPVSTTVPVFTTTSSSSLTTTTISQPCPVELIYNEDSEEAVLLRYIRDTILRTTPEGREVIKLYYALSPSVVKAVKEDEGFREEVREMVDRVLGLIWEGAE